MQHSLHAISKLYYYFQQNRQCMRKLSNFERNPYVTNVKKGNRDTPVRTIEIFIDNLDQHIAQSYSKLRYNKQKAAISNKKKNSIPTLQENINELKDQSSTIGNTLRESYREQSRIICENILNEKPTLISNQEVKQYINYVYQTYNIPDPMQSEQTQKKVIVMRSSNRRTATDMSLRKKNSANSIKDRIVQQKNIDLHPFHPNDTQQCRLTTSVYTNQQKRSFQGTKKGFAQGRVTYSAHKEYPEKTKSRHMTEVTLLSEVTTTKINAKEIPQVFRYCFACQKAVLQTNLRHHEDNCLELQQTFQKSYKELLEILQEKITRLSKEVQQRFAEPQAERYLSDVSNLKTLVGEWMTEVGCSHKQNQTNSLNNSMRDSYGKVQSQLQRMVGQGMEAASKLHWFSRLRQNLARQCPQELSG